MSVINCEINVHPNLSKRCIIVATTAADQGATFSITDTKIYVPVLILSTQYNAKLLEQIKSAFKRINGTNINKTFHQKDKTNNWII